MTMPTADDFLKAQRIAWGPLMFQAARAAREMGVLAAVKEEALTATEVSQRANVSYYAARVLLEACAALELMTDENQRYRLTPAGFVILTDAMTRVNLDFVHDVCFQGAFYLQESLEQGKPVGLKAHGDWPTVYAGLTQTTPQFQKSWFGFDHFYSDPVFRHAIARMNTDGVRTVLDVGGNTGRFALQAAKSLQVTTLDHPAQLQLLKANALKAGVTVNTAPIDLLDHAQPFPTDFDAVWLSQLLDCFPEADITELLRRSKHALNAKGRIYVLEPLWDRQPHALARFNVVATSLYFSCIANGTSRMYHSGDLLECARAAGLKVADDKPLGHWHTLLVFENATVI